MYVQSDVEIDRAVEIRIRCLNEHARKCVIISRRAEKRENVATFHLVLHILLSFINHS